MDVVTIHRGHSVCLPSVLRQIQRNGDTAHLLGNSHSQSICPGLVVYHPISSFWSGAAAFAPTYEHHGANDYDYELFCLQRWLVLREFAAKTGIKRFLHIDSDVMLYANMGRENERFSSFAFTLSKGHCGHCSFMSSDAIMALAETIIRLFRDKGEEWKWMMAQNVGPLSDMTLLEYFRLKGGMSCGETTTVADGTTFDHNIQIPQQTMSSYLEKYAGFILPEWEMNGDTKRIIWQGGKPYGRLLGTMVRFLGIHFSGAAKHLAAANEEPR